MKQDRSLPNVTAEEKLYRGDPKQLDAYLEEILRCKAADAHGKV